MPTILAPTFASRLPSLSRSHLEEPAVVIPVKGKGKGSRSRSSSYKIPAFRLVPDQTEETYYLDDVPGGVITPEAATKDFFFSILFIPLSVSEKEKQQQLFTQFLFYMDSLCSQTNKDGSVIVLTPHRLSGLGNNIRSLMTAFFIAVTTNRGIRSRFFSVHFTYSRFQSKPLLEHVCPIFKLHRTI